MFLIIIIKYFLFIFYLYLILRLISSYYIINIYKIKIFKSNNLSINFSMMLFLSISLSSFNLLNLLVL